MPLDWNSVLREPTAVEGGGMTIRTENRCPGGNRKSDPLGLFADLKRKINSLRL